MSPVRRIAAFAGALAVIFGLAVVFGGALGSDDSGDRDRAQSEARPAAEGHDAAGHEDGASGQDAAGHDEAADSPAGQDDAGHGDAGHDSSAEPSAPAGLSVDDGTYRLALERPRLAAAAPGRLSFRILDRRGRAVTAYEPLHDRELHLIVVGRDLHDYRHVHPTRAADGTWSVNLTLPRAGSYRAYADFQAGGKQRTLGADLDVPGAFAPRPLPAASTTAAAGPYRVTVADGAKDELDFTVRRDGRGVDDLEDYLGAKGHLVVIRAGDLAYLHTHPETDSLRFHVAVPGAGSYRMFLQFRHGGTVRTAAFTREASS